MSDRCPYCGADVRESLYTLKTFNCNTKHSLFSEEWVYWQSVECKDRQIANLTASRDRWKALAKAQIDYSEMQQRIAIDAETAIKKLHKGREVVDAIATLKEHGEWED